MNPLLTIEISGKQFKVYLEETFETHKDNRGGCLFRLAQTGKKFFAPFYKFSFVL